MGSRANAIRSGMGAFFGTVAGNLSDVRRERRAGDAAEAESGRRMGEMTLRQALEQADPRNKASLALTQQQTSTSAAQGRNLDANARQTDAQTGVIPTDAASRATSAASGMLNAQTSAASEGRIGETTDRAVDAAAKKLTASETKGDKVRAWTALRDADPTKYWEIFSAADEDVVDSDVFKAWLTTFRNEVKDAALSGGMGGEGKFGATGGGSSFVGPAAQAPAATTLAPAARRPMPVIGDTTETKLDTTQTTAGQGAVAAENTAGLNSEEIDYIRQQAKQSGVDFNTARSRLEAQIGR